jgi:hypothetical protein
VNSNSGHRAYEPVTRVVHEPPAIFCRFSRGVQLNPRIRRPAVSELLPRPGDVSTKEFPDKKSKKTSWRLLNKSRVQASPAAPLTQSSPASLNFRGISALRYRMADELSSEA